MTTYEQIVEERTCDLNNAFPGNDEFISKFTLLVTTYPPPFIYVYDPNTPRITASLINNSLSTISAIEPSPFDVEDPTPRIAFAQVNAVACFTPRLFYDTVLNQLVKWRPRWEDSCENWAGPSDGIRYNDSIDGFMHGLRAANAQLVEVNVASRSGEGRKGKGKASAHEVRMFLVIERAERVRDSLPELMVPLARLAELVSWSLILIIFFHVDSKKMMLVTNRHNNCPLVGRAVGQYQATLGRRTRPLQDGHSTTSERR